MAITNVQIASTQTTQLFLASGEQAVTTIFFCNTAAASDAAFDLYIVPAGHVATTATQVLKSLSLPAKETFVFDAEKIILGNGDGIFAQADTNLVITATVSSVAVG